MTREEAVKEIEKAFEPAFANYIITALTEGATVSDKEQGTEYIQAIYTEALEEGIRCAMCTNTIKSDTGCDGGCIVDRKMYHKVMTEINSRLLRQPPRKGYIEREVLDKIRAEIKQLRNFRAENYDLEKYCDYFDARIIFRDDVLQIIDKNREESEET